MPMDTRVHGKALGQFHELYSSSFENGVWARCGLYALKGCSGNQAMV